ncbi:hypothetical protein A9Q78_07500 [Methylophaga sp. 41_12_T18]|nr:hypothetical protein A9Q78_07500 [Methylophaga sp. 41_12_T18]
MNITCQPLRFALIASTLLFVPQLQATELDLTLTESTALTSLADSDWVMLKAKARDVLTLSPDGENHTWQNDETGNSGVITVLNSSTENEQSCRNTQFINTANSLTSTTTVNLCQQLNGQWTEQNRRITTTDGTPVNSDTNSHSDMFGDMNATPTTAVTAKTLSQTSEFCRNLGQQIVDLKGSPLRRSAAIEQHKAQCRR